MISLDESMRHALKIKSALERKTGLTVEMSDSPYARDDKNRTMEFDLKTSTGLSVARVSISNYGEDTYFIGGYAYTISDGLKGFKVEV